MGVPRSRRHQPPAPSARRARLVLLWAALAVLWAALAVTAFTMPAGSRRDGMALMVGTGALTVVTVAAAVGLIAIWAVTQIIRAIHATPTPQAHTDAQAALEQLDALLPPLPEGYLRPVGDGDVSPPGRQHAAG